jgi:hypothetical protein
MGTLDDPEGLLAVITKAIDAGVVTAGVPNKLPVEESKNTPDGRVLSAGLMSQLSTVPATITGPSLGGSGLLTTPSYTLSPP